MNNLAPHRHLRVLHLITDLDIGGAENMLSKLVGAMDQSRFDNVIVSMMSDGALRPLLEQTGLRVISLDMRRGTPNPLALLRLRRLLAAEQPDELGAEGLLGREEHHEAAEYKLGVKARPRTGIENRCRTGD